MIKNLIFDFGGVLYKINPYLTIQSFAKFTSDIEKFQQALKSQSYKKHIKEFEKGNLNSNQFRQQMKKEFDLYCNNLEFDNAWNNLLIGIMDFSIPLIEQLKQNYNIYLLSNTNIIHYNHFLPQCRELFALFNKCFFSYKIGSVKPENEIFNYLLARTNINTDETIFIDDSKENIISANELGFQTFLVENSNTPHILKFLYYE